MKLLGAYPSTLLLYHREEILSLLQQAVAAGDYGGGKLIDAAAVRSLEQQVADFSQLPAISAGQRALAQSLLYPLSLIEARYSTISKERDSFLGRMSRYLDLLEKDSQLLDQLIAAANMKLWVERQGRLSGSTAFYQDFRATHGPVAVDLPQTDPATGALYTKSVEDLTVFFASGLRQGIGAPVQVKRLAPVGLRWNHGYAAPAVEDLTGDEWAKLSVLESQPLVFFGGPVATVLNPAGSSIADLFDISGQDVAGNLPVFVRTFFTPRRLSQQIESGPAGEAVMFSGHQVVGDNFLVLDDARSYDNGIDFVVDEYGRFVPRQSAANKTLKILFTAMLPAYSCSTSQEQWSPETLLGDAVYPLTDETGADLGLRIRMRKTPAAEYLFRVDSAGAGGYGASAVLEMELDRPSFIDGLHLAPFSNYPARLESVVARGLTDDSTSILFDSADLLLDRPVTIRFPGQVVHRLFLTFRQENYVLVEHVIDPADQLRRDAMVAIQAALPFSSRRMHVTPARRVSGAQYEFGLRDLWAESRPAASTLDYGVLICGPFEAEGTPSLVRLTAQFAGEVGLYLIDKPFNTTGVQVGSEMCSENQHGFEVESGVAFGYPLPAGEATLSKTQFYVKFVLRDPDAVVERFLLEVTD